MSDRETAIRRVREAARSRESASIAGREEPEELRKCCIDAQRAGVPVTKIAEEAGLPREELDDLVTRHS